MAQTAEALITAAYREGNIIPRGKEPTAAEKTEALTRLNAFLRAVIGQELGSRLHDWPVPSGQRATSDFHTTTHAPFPASVEGVAQPSPGTAIDTGQWPYPPDNSRLLVKITQATTIYFPEQPAAGARMRAIDVGASSTLTISGNGRLVEGSTTRVLASGFTARDWFYRDDLADWVEVADMALTDMSVLPDEFDEFLIAALSIRLSPAEGQDAKDGTVEAFQRGFRKLKAYYQQTGYSVGLAADVPRSAQSYGREF